MRARQGVAPAARAAGLVMAILATALAGGATPQEGAQEGAQDTRTMRLPALQKSPLLAEAERLGLLAGQAEYCQVEPDRLDDFIARAHARLSTMARKDPLAVTGARVEFNAFAALGRAEGPQGGCTAFLEIFHDAHRALQ